jgi:16S rRNA (cytidine1402-2'-O)-methyltransferase
MAGTLYLVPTPIGNLEDMTLRALRVLKQSVLIACEDTRTSRTLLSHFEIDTPVTSYHEHNKLSKLDALFEVLDTGDVSLISDAGTPGVSDPGFELVREAIARGYTVVPLPGPNALLPALTGSGLPTDSFVYLGFPPRKGLREWFGALKDERRTMLAYESPHRLTGTLEALADALGSDRPAVVAREISKKFEEFVRGTAGEVLAHMREQPPRGEITLVIGGAPESALAWDEARVRAALRERLAAGESRSQAAKAVAADSGWRKGDVYGLDEDA